MRELGRDALILVRCQIVAGDGSANKKVRVRRIGIYVTAFAAALNGAPIVERDRAVRSTAGNCHCPAVLLRAVKPVGEAVVGDDVIELAGGLVVPGTPGLRAINSDDRALVAP